MVRPLSTLADTDTRIGSHNVGLEIANVSIGNIPDSYLPVQCRKDF